MKMTNYSSLSPIFIFLFSCILFSQFLYSNRPQEINFILLFQVGTLGLFLVYGYLKILKSSNRLYLDRLALISLIFVFYFYSFGVLLSYLNGAHLLDVIEFPHRISFLLIVPFLPKLISKEKDLNIIFLMLMLLIVAILIRDLIFWKEEERIRIVGKGFSPLSIVSAFPFAVGSVIAYWNNSKWKNFTRIFLLLFVFLSILKVFFSFSRSVWLLNFPVTILFLFFLIKKGYSKDVKARMNRRRIMGAFIFLFLVGIISVIILLQINHDFRLTIFERFSMVSTSFNVRMDEFRNAFEVWKNNPIIGTGFGVESVFYKGARLREQDYVHNWILQFLQSGGIIGLILILSLIFESFRSMLFLLKKSDKTMLQTGILSTCFLLLLNIVLQGLIQTVLQRLEIYFMLSLIISFVIAIKKIQKNHIMNTRAPV